jgi:hypothetical protein
MANWKVLVIDDSPPTVLSHCFMTGLDSKICMCFGFCNLQQFGRTVFHFIVKNWNLLNVISGSGESFLSLEYRFGTHRESILRCFSGLSRTGKSKLWWSYAFIFQRRVVSIALTCEDQYYTWNLTCLWFGVPHDCFLRLKFWYSTVFSTLIFFVFRFSFSCHYFSFRSYWHQRRVLPHFNLRSTSKRCFFWGYSERSMMFNRVLSVEDLGDDASRLM